MYLISIRLGPETVSRTLVNGDIILEVQTALMRTL